MSDESLRLSEQLRELQKVFAKSFLWGLLGDLISQAETMEEAIDSWPTERRTDPETSSYDGTPESLRECQQALIRLFSSYGTMDDETMTVRYQQRHRSQPYTFPRQAPSGLRTRRSGLVKLGILEVVDNLGVSPTGRAARRYRLSSEV